MNHGTFPFKLTSQREMAESFGALHRRGTVLILPNAWDVPSARVFEDEGFPAVATSSAAMMVSLGYPDGEVIPRDEYFKSVRRLATVLTVPLSVDAAAGFGRTPGEVSLTVRKLVKAGAIGLNIEDFQPGTNRLLSVDLQVQKIKAAKAAGEGLKVPMFVNARTDALRFGKGDEDARFGQAVQRAVAYRDAGADCVYPMGLVEASRIKEFVGRLSFPVNVMVRKGLPTVSELNRLGVARVSFGPYASYAAMGLLRRISREVQGKGTYEHLVHDAITFEELNRLASPRERPVARPSSR